MDFTPELALTVLKGYVLTVIFETAVLLLGLSRQHSIKRRLIAGVWLSAASYPFVIFLFPRLINPIELETVYRVVSETFAPLFECFLFWLVYYRLKEAPSDGLLRDMSTIVIANLFSYGMGLVIESFGFVI
ncbi:MAG: hypothetical protein AB7W16_23295 [Candidatus Obscuribacterales bacterium]